MVTKQVKDGTGAVDEADLTRADSLAREIFSDVANKWAFLIIETLGERTLRFGEVRDAIEGISHKMLTQNLRMLEHNGLVERTVHPTVPPRVEYTLTEPGRGLRATVDAMCAWTHRYLADIEAARGRYSTKPSGNGSRGSSR
ncbi:helix-turn-helix domain-containing protein [Streptomyces albiaxialis]|uniref:Helix-turn-helix domain-containing protein n=1 Tax=Streptomyces albiaxialis TaxID=329523 RepID=A0ABN2W0T0_9ACTN